MDRVEDGPVVVVRLQAAETSAGVLVIVKAVVEAEVEAGAVAAEQPAAAAAVARRREAGHSGHIAVP